MKLNKIYVTGLIAAAIFSSCGRNDYNGVYSGTSTNGAATATNSASTIYNQPIYNQGYAGYQTQDTVTLTLNQNGEQVQGNYTSGTGENGVFYATARSSNQLDNVQLNVSSYSGANGYNQGYQTIQTGNGAYCQGSFYTGTLSAPDDARQITGTLSVAGGTMVQNPLCQAKTFRLFKNGNSR